jgi:eukaryotic-like serine/threonine-protein kinase
MPGDRKRDLEIFTEAIQLPREERMTFLDGACGDDVELRRRVAALLKSNDRAGGFLETPPTGSISAERAKTPIGEKPGDQVDRYKLLAQIGEGGCGVVFVAEQEVPVHRRVALKLVKPGMDTTSVVARFEAERQALALMDHPNIAHVFDAGATQNGRPYFVMELVDGIKITDYCDQHSLPINARLELFVQVCDAIQHAHQKGIIHRDIKPSNVLVATGPDGEPTPKVIDFGVAKATLGLQLTDKTIFTAREMLIGTPAYMSPEQAALTSAELDTRTDIYSLGVLLYELLIGLTPFDAGALLKAGLDEVRRVIREEEPVRPSTRLAMMAGDLPSVAEHRRTNPPTLIRAVRGDLDWIAMKAMEKDRERRYATPHSLALDVQRFLAHEVVSARSPSAFYKFEKLVRRNRLLFAGLGVIAALVVISLVIVSIALRREKRAHQDALTEASRSIATSEFMNEMIMSVDPATAKGRDAATVFREMLDKAADRVATQFTNQPVAQADLKATIGEAYGSFGLFEKEESMMKAALAVYGDSPTAARKIAVAHSDLSEMYARKGDFLQSEREAREALAVLKGQETVQVMVARIQLARAILREGRTAEAEAMLRSAQLASQRLPDVKTGQRLAINSLLASALAAEGQITNAEKLSRDAVAMAQAKFGSNSLQAVDMTASLIFFLANQGKLEEAERLSRQSVAIVREITPPDHPEREQALFLFGRLLHSEGKNAEAAPVFRELLEIRRKIHGAQDSRVMETATLLAQSVAPDGDESKLKNLADDVPEVWVVISENLAGHGRWPDAIAAASRFLTAQPTNHVGYHLMAPLLAQTGDRSAYEDLCAKISALFAGARDPYVADRMAKDCLMLPRPGADLTTPSELAETAVTVGAGDAGSLPYFQCCKALAELRQSHFDAAIAWARKAARGANPYSQAEAEAILAMSHFQLKQIDDSRLDLQKCSEVVQTKMPKPGDADLGGDWRDWIICHALLHEATGMIGRVSNGSVEK